jgi:hypothetical protein
MAIQHWMTFGTFAEQRYFIYPSASTYYGIIINGNMAAHAPDGLAAFLLEKTREKIPYIIDPLTHAFQHDPTKLLTSKKDGTMEIKSSILGLAEHYGGIVKTILGSRPILPKDFNNANNDEPLINFVTSCLNFQKNQLAVRMAGSEVNLKYLEHEITDLVPYALVSPYFFMTESTIDLWLPIMIRGLKIAKEISAFDTDKIFASLVLSQGVIVRNDLIQKIIDSFNSIDVDGFLIWIDNLDEHYAGGEELKGLIKLARGLNRGSREVINLHGSYFSILASGDKFGDPSFSGVAHGPEFGESRPVMPVGGGIPIAKYYLKNLHNRIRYTDALNFLLAKNWLKSSKIYYENVCNCDECTMNVIKDNIDNFKLFGVSDSKPVKRGRGYVTLDYPTKETKEHCLRHYLQIKNWEFEFASTASKNELLQNLEKGKRDFEEIAGLEYVSYLDIWKTVLTSS